MKVTDAHGQLYISSSSMFASDSILNNVFTFLWSTHREKNIHKKYLLLTCVTSLISPEVINIPFLQFIISHSVFRGWFYAVPNLDNSRYLVEITQNIYYFILFSFIEFHNTNYFRCYEINVLFNNIIFHSQFIFVSKHFLRFLTDITGRHYCY